MAACEEPRAQRGKAFLTRRLVAQRHGAGHHRVERRLMQRLVFDRSMTAAWASASEKALKKRSFFLATLRLQKASDRGSADAQASGDLALADPFLVELADFVGFCRVSNAMLVCPPGESSSGQVIGGLRSL
jgi:hypothetical protein